MIDEATRDPISVGMLNIDGKKIMELQVKFLDQKLVLFYTHFLKKFFDDPKLNTEEYLNKRAIDLSNFLKKELKEMGEEGNRKKERK
jgi:hypothetical protein